MAVVCQALIGVALNTVAFLLAAWRHVDAVGSHTPLISGAGSFFLVGIALLSLVAALVFGVAGINALMDAPRIGAQCPLAQCETGGSSAGVEAGSMTQGESQAVGCGSAWENELSSALTGKGGAKERWGYGSRAPRSPEMSLAWARVTFW